MFTDYYQVLEVHYEATLQEIRKAYRVQLQKWHPDHNTTPAALERTQIIIEASLILSDAEARRLFDIAYKVYYDNKGETFKTAAFRSGNNPTIDFDGKALKRLIETARDQASKMSSQTLAQLTGETKAVLSFRSRKVRLVTGVVVTMIIVMFGLVFGVGSKAAESTETTIDSYAEELTAGEIAMSKVDSLLNDTTNVNRYGDAYPYLLEAANINNGYNRVNDARLQLGEMYRNGYGVKEDAQKALEWYIQCASTYTDCGYLAGVLYENQGKLKQAMEYYHSASAGNSANAQWRLGRIFLFESKYRNYDSAVLYLNKSIQNGDLSAYALLGRMYEEGYLYNKDERKAFQLFKKSLPSGEGYLYSNMGRCFRDGIGCVANKDSAVVYLRKGVALGDQDASEALLKLESSSK